MHDHQIAPRQGELVPIQNVAVLQAHIIRLIKEALALHPRHVKDVQRLDHIFQLTHLCKRHAGPLHLFPQVGGNAQLVRGDEHKLHALVTAHGCEQAVYRAAKLEIAA